MRLLLQHKLFTGVMAALSVLYIVQSALLSPDPNVLARYNITSGKLVFLSLTFALPYIVIWFIALSGYLRLRTYANTIAGDKDGKAFDVISKGLLGLTLWLPLSSILTNIVSRGVRFHHSYAAPLVWLQNYSVLILLFTSFSLVFLGARRLAQLVGTQRPTARHESAIGFFVGMVAIYAIVLLHDPSRNMPAGDVKLAAYYLSDILIVITILIPRIFMWYLGILAVQYIYRYLHNISGTIYREGMQNVAAGFSFVIVSTITLRYFDSLATEFNHLNLGAALIVVYALLALIGAGYLLIEKGARKLQRIEEL